MTDEAVVRVENVSVKYNRQLVIDQVSLEVARGSVYALLGRNGAGKSSLMRCLLGLQKPTSGRVKIFGEDVWTHRARLLARAAYVPETSDAPGQLRVRDVVAFHQSMYPTWDQGAVKARLVAGGRERDRDGLGALERPARALHPGSRPRQQARAAGSRRPHPRPRRGGAQRLLLRLHRRTRGPRHHRDPDHPRPRRRGRHRRSRGHPPGLAPRPRRGCRADEDRPRSVAGADLHRAHPGSAGRL